MADNNMNPPFEAGARYQEDIARSYGRMLALDNESTKNRIWDNSFEEEARGMFEVQHPTILWESVRDFVYDAWIQHTESRFVPGPGPYYNPDQYNDGQFGEENRRATDDDNVLPGQT